MYNHALPADRKKQRPLKSSVRVRNEMKRKPLAFALLIVAILVSAFAYVRIDLLERLHNAFEPRYINITSEQMTQLLSKEQLANNAVTAMAEHRKISTLWLGTIHISKFVITLLIGLVLIQALIILVMAFRSNKRVEASVNNPA